MLLAAEDAENPQKRLTDTEIRDQALTLFIAGHETTANALAWTWHLLARHEAVRVKMKEEIDAVLGAGRLPGLEDAARGCSTPRLLVSFPESMRLFPPVWVVGRRAVEDVTIGDYEVPRRTICHRQPIYSSSRTQTGWAGGWCRLRPGTMAGNEQAQAARPKFAYFPFGGGGRICIGDAFAWTEGVLILAVMARRWRFETAPGHRDGVNPTVMAAPVLYGLKMIVRDS